MATRNRVGALIDECRRSVKWVVVIAAPILLLCVVGVSIASQWKQYRVYSAYGVSVAMDKHVLVLEREFPAGFGYRAVGTADETLHILGRDWFLAINKRPYDSEVRKWQYRYIIPQAGALRSPTKHGCRWVSFPSWLVAGVLLLVSALSYRETVGRPPHCCRRCGYDLRGIGEDSPCPECGSTRKTPAARADRR